MIPLTIVGGAINVLFSLVKKHRMLIMKKKCPSSKIRSKEKGRGLGRGKGGGPIGFVQGTLGPIGKPRKKKK